MLIILTYVEKNEDDELSLFAGQNINEGDIIWFLDPTIDFVFTKNQFEDLVTGRICHILTTEQSENIKKWAYKRDNDYILCSDNMKFAGYSKTPNCKNCGQYDVVTKNVRKGEELTYEQISESTEGTEGYSESRKENGKT